MNIKELIKKGETQRIEFKKSLAERKEILKTISAFANSKGGKIFVGIEENKDGSVKEIIGIKIRGREIENLSNEIKQNTDPVMFPSIEIRGIKGKHVLSIEVTESPLKPVFTKIDKIPVAFKRVGKVNQKITANELRRMISEGKEFLWDSQICEDSILDDIDWEFVEKVFIQLYEEVSKKKLVGSSKELLNSLGCIKNNEPTNAGILLFGKNPQKFFMNSYIALARYKGEEVSVKRLDYKEFSDNLFKQIDQCNRYIKDHITVMSRLLPYQVRRQDIPEYELFSIRELITNAVCHRDYYDQHTKVIIKMFSDKIEFYNPGCLPGEVTPENITEKQYSRNPIIARVLAKVEYIEELGEGWNKIIDEHKKHLLKPNLPSIKADRDSVLITIFSTINKFEEEKFLELSERQKKIIEYLKENKKITRSICMKILDISKDTALRELSKLVSKNIIKREGIGRGIYYVLK